MLLGFRPLKEYLFMFFKTSFQRNFSLQGAMLISNTINQVYPFVDSRQSDGNGVL